MIHLKILKSTRHAVQRYNERNKVGLNPKNTIDAEVIRSRIAQDLMDARELTPFEISTLPLRDLGEKITDVNVKYFLRENRLYVVKHNHIVLTTWLLRPEDLNILNKKIQPPPQLVIPSEILPALWCIGYDYTNEHLLTLIERSGRVLRRERFHGISPKASTKQFLEVMHPPFVHQLVEVDANNRVRVIHDLTLKHVPTDLDFPFPVLEKIFKTDKGMPSAEYMQREITRSFRISGKKIHPSVASRYGLGKKTQNSSLFFCVIQGQAYVLEYVGQEVIKASPVFQQRKQKHRPKSVALNNPE